MVSGQSGKSDTQVVRTGDCRRFVAAVFGVWALLIQSLLPVGGALAAQSGDAFWISLCTSAGIEQVAFGNDEDGSNGSDPARGGCDVCTVCACASGTGCGCGVLKLVLQERQGPLDLKPHASSVPRASLALDAHRARAPPA